MWTVCLELALTFAVTVVEYSNNGTTAVISDSWTGLVAVVITIINNNRAGSVAIITTVINDNWVGSVARHGNCWYLERWLLVLIGDRKRKKTKDCE
jgi:hypothetical protein